MESRSPSGATTQGSTPSAAAPAARVIESFPSAPSNRTGARVAAISARARPLGPLADDQDLASVEPGVGPGRRGDQVRKPFFGTSRPTATTGPSAT